MRLYVFTLVIITALAFAVDPRDYGATQNPAPGQPATDNYVINVINTFECPYASMILGLDYVSNGDFILFTDDESGDENLFVCNAGNGTYVNAIDMPWTTPSPFGIGDFYPAGSQPHCNDFGDDLIRYGINFTGSYPNVYDENGRGMDCDGTYIWEAFGPMSATYGACLRMFPDGTSVQAWNLPGITTQLSGLTVYPIPGKQGIAVTAYEWGSPNHYIWFYEFNGSTMSQLGSADLPSCLLSFGLAYSGTRDTFFWSWMNASGICFISELEITETSLEETTWGSIKASF
ncbi:MAG: hypothetical protein KAT09_00770 [Candidatus Aegiribacteria sp.]|nr:hypothetical protein [Candidatus Aegiribacteria sp.]